MTRRKKRDAESEEVLLDLLKAEGSPVADLPYSSQFESACEKIDPSATTDDKHRFWKKLLDLREFDDSRPESADAPRASAEVAAESDLRLPAGDTHSPARSAQGRGETGWLFETEDSVAELQPWGSTPRESLPVEQAERRQRMLSDIADSRLGSCEQRVAFILQRFPETRDSDTRLCIKYWKMFHADVLERWQPMELEVLFELDRIETIGRVRRVIQNELQLFRGVEDRRRARDAMQGELHEYLAAHRDTLSEVRFYLDETGNEGDKAYIGIGGMCVINWKQFEKHSAALELWRSQQGWAETIHFSEMGADKVERAVSLLAQLQKRRAGTLFLGYSLASRGRTHQDLFSLFVQLVVDSLLHLRAIGCLGDRRSVRVIKEADVGFDSLFLQKMSKYLSEQVAMEFPGELAVLPVEAVTKGRTVLLECADLIAGGMQRRALTKGRNPKDKLAEAVINVTGFEDRADAGALFKYHATNR